MTTEPLIEPATLRPAGDADVEAITTIWYEGWRDGHLGHVPAELARYRQPAEFRQRVPGMLRHTTVATAGAGRGEVVIGFIVVRDDEIEQVYVDRSARGTGVAGLLLARGEAAVATRSDRAWLAVVAGNQRARRFYERHGWFDAGPIDYPARTAAGVTVAVPARRYEKRLVAGGADAGSSDTDGGGQGAGR